MGNTEKSHTDPGEHYSEVVSRIIEEKTGLIVQADELEKLLNNVLRRAPTEAIRGWLAEMDRHSVDSDEFLATLESVLNNETSFFRHPAQFQILERKVFGEIWREGTATYDWRKLRMMSAGCSVGAEAYSMLISAVRFISNRMGLDYVELFDAYQRYSCHYEALDHLPDLSKIMMRVMVDGYDIVPLNIKRCGQGVFSTINEPSFRTAFPDKDVFLRDLDGDREEGGENRQSIISNYKIHGLLRDLAHFQRANLQDRAFCSLSYDIVFCRNVLMYSTVAAQEKIVSRLVDTLEDGGFIFFAPTDFPPASALSELEEYESHIYRKCP